jgi:arsenical pump membrane protein
MFALIGATAIVALTIALIILQPRGLNEAWAATGGAVAMLLCGFATLGDLARVTREVSDVLLFLVGMMVLTAAVECSGLFDLLALWTARAARGSGVLLFLGIFGLGFAVTALLSLDVTVLVLTPIVYALTARLKITPLPYLFICALIANVGSLLLPISNLTNLLAYGLLGLSFGSFARLMVLPQLAALVATVGLLYVLFQRQIPRRFDPTDLPERPEGAEPRFLRLAASILVTVLATLLIAGILSWPIAAPALIGGVVMGGIAIQRRVATVRTLAGDVAWSVLPFVIGMFTIIRGAERIWLDRLGGVNLGAGGFVDLLLVGFAAAFGANLINNIPMIGALIGLLGNAAPQARDALALAALLGVNLGSIVTPFGSLATLLWLTIVRRKGEQLSSLGYMRISIVIALPTLLLATLALWLVVR